MGDQTPGRVGARRLVGAAGLGVLVSGLIVNVYLAVVARALPPAEYATFGSFWALALVARLRGLPAARAGARTAPAVARRPPGAPARRERRRRACSPGSPSSCWSARCRCMWRSLDERRVGPARPRRAVRRLRGPVPRARHPDRHRPPRASRGGRWCSTRSCGWRLAVGVFIVGGADAAAFCWALVAAIVLAHLPQLPARVAARRGVGATVVPGRPADRPSVRGLTRAAMPLLVGSVCAQLLLNGLPVLVVAQAGDGQRDRGGRRVRRRVHPGQGAAVDGRAPAVGRRPHADPPDRRRAPPRGAWSCS